MLQHMNTHGDLQVWISDHVYFVLICCFVKGLFRKQNPQCRRLEKHPRVEVNEREFIQTCQQVKRKSTKSAGNNKKALK